MRSENVLGREPYKPQWEMHYSGSQFIFEDQSDPTNIAKGRLIQYKHEIFANLSHLFISEQYRSLGVALKCLRTLEAQLGERGVTTIVASFKNPETIAFLLTQGYVFAAESRNSLAINYFRDKEEEDYYVMTSADFLLLRNERTEGLMTKTAILIKDI